MKTTRIVLVCVFLAVIVSACHKDNNSPVVIQPDQKMLQLTGADNTFGLKLFQQVNSESQNSDNLFISPASVGLALAMTYNGAGGDTKTAMEQTLNLSGLTIDEINQSYQGLVHLLQTTDPNVLLTIANSIWYRNTFSVLQPFIDVNQQYYSAEVAALDFNDPGSVNIINNWVDAKTNHKITSVIQEITPDNMMFLINAIYFKGIWKYQFNPDNTTDLPFTMEDGTVLNVPMMKQKSNFNYMENDLMQGIQLPYGDEKFNMVVLLPSGTHTANHIIAQLSQTNWDNWMNSFSMTDSVTVYLPKFKFAYDITLNQALSDMGMTVAFTKMADFTGINPAGNLYISNVIHKSFVDVNEEGTEAAAVTVVTIGTSCVGPEKYFYAQKPFVFAITEKSSNSIVFLGKIAQPEIQ
ncbi:MAG: serpin family protein [Bacteroidia bacterium]|nr:serpin family protein [Bacteroidia bacterium]